MPFPNCVTDDENKRDEKDAVTIESGVIPRSGATRTWSGVKLQQNSLTASIDGRGAELLFKRADLVNDK
jgi:hypothetical protein